MTDAELTTAWLIGVAVAGVVVLLAAALLLMVLSAARSILRHGAEALAAAEEIQRGTSVIWALSDTNRIAGEILATAERIEENGGVIAEALAETESRPVSVVG